MTRIVLRLPLWAVRWRRAKTLETPALLAALVWLCALPVILLLTLPFFGAGVALTVAAVALLAMLLVCLGICMERSEDSARSP